MVKDERSASAASTQVSTVAADGVRLSGWYRTGPGRPTRGAAPEAAVVLAHGFTNATRRPSTSAMISGFARHTAVVALDFRGHGRSSGRSSVGRDETLDIDAAVRWARERGHAPVAVVGFSMGACVAIRHAATGEHRPDGLVSVSAPSRWYIRDTGPMRRVHWMLEHPLGNAVGRALGIRLGAPWAEIPPTPLETIGAVRMPVLIVHGTADHYFGPEHAVALQRAARGAELWLEPGMGHAESAVSPELIDRIYDWIAQRVRSIGPGAPGGREQSAV